METLIALPSLELLPDPADPDLIEARIIVEGGWYHYQLPASSIHFLWKHWVEDPERCAVELFNAPLPRGARWQAPQQHPTSPEELGL